LAGEMLSYCCKPLRQEDYIHNISVYNLPQAVAYAENFHGGVWFKVIWWSFAFGMRCLWHHNMTSFPCFQTTVLAKFVDIICMFFYIHSPYFMCRCSEYKHQRFKLGYRRKINSNATTQQFINCKNIRLRVKTGELNTLITTSEQFTTTKIRLR